MFATLYLMIRAFIRHKILHIDDRSQLEIAISNGLKLGKDYNIQGECIIDPGHCWLIEIGDRVTLVILPCVEIGDKVIIGAGSVVSRSIPSNSVAVGNPAKVIGSYYDYMDKRKQQMASSPCYDYSYTIGRGVTEDKKREMIDAIKDCGVGFVE